jgi:CRISPR-associated protein Cas5t
MDLVTREILLDSLNCAKVVYSDGLTGTLILGDKLQRVFTALPKYFTDTIPRNNIGTEAYSVIPYDSDSFPTKLKAYSDYIDNKEVDIYFHQLNFG